MAIVVPITSEYISGTWSYYFNWDQSVYGPMNIDQLKLACYADADNDLEIIVTDAIGDQVIRIPAPYHGSFSANIRVPVASSALIITPTFDSEDDGDSIKSIQFILLPA
jgi:hypothetical protein